MNNAFADQRRNSLGRLVTRRAAQCKQVLGVARPAPRLSRALPAAAEKAGGDSRDDQKEDKGENIVRLLDV